MDDNSQEESVYAQWTEYTIYALILILLGIIIQPLLASFPGLAIIASSLSTPLLFIGVTFFIICIAVMLLEYFQNVNDVDEMDELDRAHYFEQMNIDVSTLRVVTGERIDASNGGKPQFPNYVNEQKVNQTYDPNNVNNQTTAKTVELGKTINQQILNEMEWKVFEDVCAAYFSELDYKSETTGLGADGGIDIKIYEKSTSVLKAIAQCKKVNNLVPVKDMREFYGVLRRSNLEMGYFMTSFTFNRHALKFAKDTGIILIDGKNFLQRIQDLPQVAQARLYSIATQEGYTIPTCVRCGHKMALRKQRTTGKKFWACPAPLCHTILNIKSTELSSRSALKR